MTEQRIGTWRIPNEGEWKLLDRLVAGDIPPDERSAIATLVARDQSLEDLLWLMRRGESSQETDEREAQRGWKEFNIRQAANQSSTPLRLISPDASAASADSPGWLPAEPSNVRTQVQMRRWIPAALRYGVVATLVSVFAVGLSLWISREETSPSDAPMHEMATQAGQQASIRLTDGTIVTLGPQSHLQVSGQFGREDRTIVLDGEALFEVAPEAKSPFIVKTKGSITRVLGTTFNVHAFGDTTTVAVVNGKVSLESPKHAIPGIVITAGYVGRLTATGDLSLLRDDVDAYTAWSKRRFVLRDTPMSTVLDDLGRWYGVRFTVDDHSFLQRRITAEWENRSLESVMKSLSLAFRIRMERHGDEVKLYTR